MERVLNRVKEDIMELIKGADDFEDLINKLKEANDKVKNIKYNLNQIDFLKGVIAKNNLELAERLEFINEVVNSSKLFLS